MGSTLMHPAFGRYLGAKKRTSELANAMVSPFALTPFAAVMLSTMFALSDDQLAMVMIAAGSVPSSSPAAPLLLLILSKQFTKRWPDVARSGDERSPLPAALVRRGTGLFIIPLLSRA